MRLPSLVLAVLLAAGCLSTSEHGQPKDADGPWLSDAVIGEAAAIRAEQKADVHDAGRDLVLAWSADLGAGAEVPLVNGDLLDQYANAAFAAPADASVRTLRLHLTGSDVAVAMLRDDEGHLLCVARTGRVCSTRVNETAVVRFPITVTSLAPGGTTVELEATLSPDEPTYGTDPTPPASTYAVFRSDLEGGEPTLAPLDAARALVVAGTKVLRLEPDGGYTDVTPPVEATLDQTLDPFLYADQATGRVYFSQLSQCLRMWWTDDGGATWLGNPEVCAGPEQHHQKITVGDGPLPGVRAVHVATMNLASWLTTDELVIFHTRSLDGGLTWSENVNKAKDADGAPEARNIGNIAAGGAAGQVLAIAYLCDRFVDAEYGGVGIGRTTDYGVTWQWQRIAPGGGRCEGIDPGLWLTDDGHAYAAWEDISAGTGHVWWAASADAGQTWGEPRAIPTPGLGSFVFTDAAATKDRLAVAFLATPDTQLGPTQAPGWARWFPYVATLDLADAGASWQVGRLQEDPVQLGPICMDGPKCLDGARNLLDFIDVQVGPAGNVFIAYPDGCEGECARQDESRSAFLRMAVEALPPPGP